MKFSYKDIDKGYKRIKSVFDRSLGETYTKVGLVGEKASAREGDLTVAQIGAVHEYGGGNNPRRSWIGAAFDKHREELFTLSQTIIKRVLDGNLKSIDQGLGILGAKFAADIKKFVTSGDPIPPPNSPEWAAYKQSKGEGTIRTLINTAQMINSVTWAVINQRK